MKGFTLIELLAVIVILAIIALIATPIVLSIINDTKESAVIRSAEFYVDAVQSKIMQENMKQGGTLNPSECIINTEGNANCDGTLLEIEVNGQKPNSGSITFDKGKVTSVSLRYTNGTITMNNKGELVLGEKEQKLAPGLYDENNNLLISWEDLTSTDYKSFTYGYPGEEVTSAILNVENGYLSSAFDPAPEENYSAEYLVGKLVIDDSVTSIGEYAFYDCNHLTSITIPDSVTSIGDLAFADCDNLTSIIIPNSVTSIGDLAFSHCRSLISITVDKNNPMYDSRNNSNAIIETATNTLVAGCKNTIIPNSVISIGNNAFFGCSSLTSITIPNSVTSIGHAVFYGCVNLTSITITDNVTSIGGYAFYECYGLTSIIISDSVTSIGPAAFDSCESLTIINYKGTETNWNAISWDDGPPSDKVINYNYVG